MGCDDGSEAVSLVAVTSEWWRSGFQVLGAMLAVTVSTVN
jgi:hypothetical protein